MMWNQYDGTANGTETCGVVPGQPHIKIERVCRRMHAVCYREALATGYKVIKDAAEEVNLSKRTKRCHT